MRKATLFQVIAAFVLLFAVANLNAQYNFPACWPAYDPTQGHYVQGSEVSLDGMNYRCKWWTTAAPPDQSWEAVAACGDGGLGADYAGPQRLIGYLPYWVPDFDLTTDFDPGVVNHINIAFLLFQQNNNDFASPDFASISFAPFHKNKVDSLLVDLDILNRAHAKGVTVSVAIGGATDFAILWLLTQYYNNDAKLEEMANVITNYVTTMGLDGVDLDLECWWPDPAIANTTEQGGRVRGDKWGGVDAGPHPAAVGLTRLCQKLRTKMPNKLISTAVFATSYYGNNYDDEVHNYVDWIGLMSYDFTGSWDASPIGPHSALYKVPLGTYPKQSADQPIYSVQDALEYWMGLAEPAWNHDGGFAVPKAKLCAGVPIYGYDFSEEKPAPGNGYKFTPYRHIVQEFPNAATSFDPLDPHGLGGHIGLNGKNIYYNTPKGAAEKVKYSQQYGHQGVIIWELTQDVDYNSSSSILKALNEAVIPVNPTNKPPLASVIAPVEGATSVVNEAITVSADASDPDGSVVNVEFFAGATLIGSDNLAPYSISWTPTVAGPYAITAKATDDSAAVTTSAAVNITVTETPLFPPTAELTAPTNGQSFDEGVAITVSANAADQDGTVSKVDFYDGANLIGTATVAPYSIVYNNASVGVHELTAVATDNDNLTGTSAVVTITVVGQPVAPTVAITAPTDNQQFDAGTDILITVNAADADGTVSKVEFFDGTILIGTSTLAPFSYTWSGAAVGPHSIKAVATDNDNLTGESAIVSISVVDVPVPPVVSITSPANGDQFPSGAVVTVTANPSDADGTISSVAFYDGAALIGTATASPYSVSFSPADGPHALKAVATDNDGLTGESSIVNITVGTSQCPYPAWDPTAIYNANDTVSHAGNAWRAKWWTTGEEPGTTGQWGVWEDLGPCTGPKAAGIESLTAQSMSSYPNPFEDKISFTFTLTEKCDVSLQIIDARGAVVTNLVSTQLGAGHHEYRFEGAHLESGLYFCTMTVNGQLSHTERLLKK